MFSCIEVNQWETAPSKSLSLMPQCYTEIRDVRHHVGFSNRNPIVTGDRLPYDCNLYPDNKGSPYATTGLKMESYSTATSLHVIPLPPSRSCANSQINPSLSSKIIHAHKLWLLMCMYSNDRPSNDRQSGFQHNEYSLFFHALSLIMLNNTLQIQFTPYSDNQ